MAYCRWDRNCDWYIFWDSSIANEKGAAGIGAKSKDEELLAVWKVRLKDSPRFKYSEVREMLESNDFSRIPGFDEGSRKLLRDCMTAFVLDVDGENESAS